MKVESFSLDHYKVRAPYVRLAKVINKGDITIYKYDLRFCQPNQESMPVIQVHTLEHLLSTYFRDYIEVIDLSPMGCFTRLLPIYI